MRGQAFLVCSDEEQAEAAITKLQGTILYGKPLRLSFSRKFSDVTAKMRGQFDESVKQERQVKNQESIDNKQKKKIKKMIEKLHHLRQ